jgi:3-oxoacyl-[acyl-carrier-protein] synthase-1
MTKPPVYLSALGIVNALGSGIDQGASGLFAGDSTGIVPEAGWLPAQQALVGRVNAALPEMRPAWARYRSRNNQLLLAALEQIRPAVDAALSLYGAQRIGAVIGSSTSGIAEGEAAISAYKKIGRLPDEYDYMQQEVGAPAVFLARFLGLGGPAYTISTACTSSAKAFSSARRLLQQGFCDAVLVGGVDSLCKLTLNGFNALESISPELCNPLSRNRRGINIGEGAALFLMQREPDGYQLLGIGESSDAYHISAPDPQGCGAERAMRDALHDADVQVADVAYLNLHATATIKNDEMESRAVDRVFSKGVPVSGTKALTGHMLGAAGATELAFCWLCLRAGRLPPHRWDEEADPALPALQLVGEHSVLPSRPHRVCMSNAFAFGGNNISVLIGDPR